MDEFTIDYDEIAKERKIEDYLEQQYEWVASGCRDKGITFEEFVGPGPCCPCGDPDCDGSCPSSSFSDNPNDWLEMPF